MLQSPASERPRYMPKVAAIFKCVTMAKVGQGTPAA